PGAVAPGLLDKRPEVNVVAVNVRAPGEDKLGEPEVFRGRAHLFSVDQIPGSAAGFGANGPVETAGAQTVKKASIHGAIAKHADGPGVTIGQDGLGAVPLANFAEAHCYRIESFVPADALEGFVFAAPGERRFGRTRPAAQWMHDALGRVDAVEVLGHFGAKEALCHGMRWVALNFYGAAFRIDGNQDAARIRTVVGADRMDDAEGRGCIHAVIVSWTGSDKAMLKT